MRVHASVWDINANVRTYPMELASCVSLMPKVRRTSARVFPEDACICRESLSASAEHLPESPDPSCAIPARRSSAIIRGLLEETIMCALRLESSLKFRGREVFLLGRFRRGEGLCGYYLNPIVHLDTSERAQT